MGWKDVFGYTRRIAAGKGIGDTSRPDDGAPLGARIGSVVQLQRSPIIRAQANGSLIAMPGDGDTRVLALSQLRLEPGTTLYRLYLATGDTDDKERFLQLLGTDEILYCTQIARMIPETAEDQEAFTGSAGYGLGDPGYTLWREQLAGMLGEAELATVFGDADRVEKDRIDYVRDAGNPGAPFVPPFTGHEIRIDDAQGEHGLRQQLYYMPYVRSLQGGGREYLLITTEIVESVDGDASRRGIHVDFVIGIPLEAERVVVQ
jgi:hypothetical protein